MRVGKMPKTTTTKVMNTLPTRVLVFLLAWYVLVTILNLKVVWYYSVLTITDRYSRRNKIICVACRI